MPRAGKKPLALGGGVNLLHDPRSIGDGQCILSKNLVPTKAGLAAKRLAMGPIYDGNILANALHFTALLHLPPGNFGDGIVTAVRRFDGASPGTLVNVNSSFAPITTIAHVYWERPSQKRPLLFNFNKRLFAFAGPGNWVTDPTSLADPRTGVSIQEITPGGPLGVYGFHFRKANTLDPADRTQAGAVPQAATEYRNRAVWANFGPGYENVVVMSDAYLPDVVPVDFLSANGGHFLVGANDGDEITAITTVMLTSVGTPTETAVLVLRNYSAYLVTGETHETTDLSTDAPSLAVARINVDCGCASQETVLHTPYGVIWAGHDDVWMMREGQGVPVPVGTLIRPRLQATPPRSRYLWHAAYYDGFYRLHLFSPGSGPNETSSIPDEEWRLDLRDGIPNSPMAARWYGPMVYKSPNNTDTADVGVAAMVADTRPTHTPMLIGATRAGAYEFLVEFEKSAPRDYHDVNMGALYGGAFRNRDSEIVIDWQGKEDDHQDPMTEKGYFGADVNVASDFPATLTIEDTMDGGRQVATTSEMVPTAGAELETDTLDNENISREFQSVRFDPDEDRRFNGKTHQFRIYDQAGYPISEANEGLYFVRNGVPYATTVPRAHYDNKVDLANAVVAAMTALGTAFTHNLGVTPTDPLAITSASGTWYPDVVQGSRLWGMLGYDTSANPGAALTQTAASTIPYRGSAMMEFGGVNAMVYPIRREPT